MLLPFSEKARQKAKIEGFNIDAESIAVSKQLIEQLLAKHRFEITSACDLSEAKTLAICKVILSMCPYQLIARFAEQYSRAWLRFFRLNFPVALEFAVEVFPTFHQNGEEFQLDVFDYLNAEESLYFVNAFNGVVRLSREELINLLARQVKRKLLLFPPAGILPPEAKQAAIELSQQFALSIPKGAKLLESEDLKKMRLGVTEGSRYYACMKLSRACFKDGLSLEEAKQVILEFVKACPPSKNPFTEKEALTCLGWVYRKGQQAGAVQ